YFGAATPGNLPSNCGACHSGAGYVQPSNNTISGFCGTCHGNFHTLTGTSGGGSTSTGIGATTTSPFLRHPSDIVIKNAGEYALYTSYNLTAPPGRQTLPAAPSATVAPGSDTVTCLSCHFSHASNFPSMLRFDYSQMTAHNNGPGSNTGCFACHTTKDE
ncbi:MAG: cytochrome c3 family protein, partial [Desulfobulbaceae bacterium]|nr:cytochrome c3 family protein [Desulfobulbaceae bacterium]